MNTNASGGANALPDAGTDESCASGVPCCDLRDKCIAGHSGTLIR